MPGRPIEAIDNINPRVADQMCRWDSLPHLSLEEQLAAEESLSAYCKPVELYNVLRRRAIDRPTFLQRCLRYKQQEKNKRRIQMAISLTGNIVRELHTQSLFPMYVLLARPVQVADMQNSEVYNYSRIGVLTCSTGTEGLYPSQVNFMLPEMDKLAAVIEDNYFTVLLVSCAENSGVMSGNDLTKNHRNMTSFPSNIGGSVLIGEIPLARMFNSWKESRRSNERERAVMYTTVDMNPRVLKPSALDVKKCLCFQIPSSNSGDFSLPLQVPVSGSAEEVWAKEKNACNVYHNGGATSSLSDLSRLLRNGNVNFYYRFFNNKYYIKEVTEDFSCPFCLVKGASYEGLRNHLLASHDLFNFEFMVTEEVQAVHVFINSDQWSSEIQDGVDPKRAAFKYCNRPFRRLLSVGLGQGARHVTPLALESSDLQVATNEAQCRVNGGMDYFEHITSSLNAAGCSSATTHSCAEFECAQSAPGNKSVPPHLLQFAKSRKLSAERSDPRKSLLQKRQFFHSHRAQPMALEQVLSDRDSEDEVDDDVADFEDRRMLDDFVDVTKDEKQMMHLWNSFVRRHGVLADGHIPWACEAFTRSHGQALTLAPALLWCWRLFMVKLWNHGLLDARTMDSCNKHLEQYQVKERDPSK